MADEGGLDTAGRDAGPHPNTPVGRVVRYSLLTLLLGAGLGASPLFLDPRPNPVLAPFVLAALGSPLILSIIDFRRGGNALVTLLATMVAGLVGLFAVSAAFVPL